MNPQPEFTFAFACDGVPGIRGQIVKAYGKVLVIQGVAMDANSWFTKTGMNVQRYSTRADAEVAAAWLAADAGGRWGVWASTSGGVTGSRQAWMKGSSGQPELFNSKEEAEKAAAEARSGLSGRSSAMINYSARAYDGARDCDLTGDEPGVMKNSPYTPEQQRAAVARQKEWEKKQGSNWKAPKSNLHPSGEGHADDAEEQRWRVTGWAQGPTGNKYLKMHQIYAPSKEAAIAQFQAKEPDATQVSANAASAFVHSDESVSQAQHGAMGAAAGGKSKLGIPKSVGAEFMKAYKGKGFDDNAGQELEAELAELKRLKKWDAAEAKQREIDAFWKARERLSNQSKKTSYSV